MKLLHCLKCGDILGLLVGKVRTCECGASKGQYVDNVNAEYEGPSRLIGINNNDLAAARGGLPGQGAEEFRCWVISDHCRPVRKLDKFSNASRGSRSEIPDVVPVGAAPGKPRRRSLHPGLVSVMVGSRGHKIAPFSGGSVAMDRLSTEMLYLGDDPDQPDMWDEDPGGYEP